MTPSELYLAAGYLLTRWVPRPPYTAAILPERLVSVSRCLAPRLPDDWAIAWAGVQERDREAGAAAFGIDRARLPAVIRWVTDRVGSEVGWPDVCFTLAAARELAAFATGPDLLLLGLGLHERDVGRLVTAEAPLPGAGGPGVREALLRPAALAPGGTALGHELLCANCGLSCSWLCHGLEVEVSTTLGVQPNAYGLVEDAEAAGGAADYVNRPETGAEPGLWLPWLLARYPLNG